MDEDISFTWVFSVRDDHRSHDDDKNSYEMSRHRECRSTEIKINAQLKKHVVRTVGFHYCDIIK